MNDDVDSSEVLTGWRANCDTEYEIPRELVTSTVDSCYVLHQTHLDRFFISNVY